ncbi:hypothetical protein Mal15_13090 [Stieleria maiorica]|uniref:Uncharacterized protein n=1 Tax=Stieleria maiorica TaxID=2795974 RepID=A0A5B9MB07_9BACT|nr:hypothetical protein [Stieleria maiorica]QEF97270.1 hypothetical protein Mal15_13090 [Stieleria maiorica]
MSVFLALTIVWIIVTLVGHLSWLALAALFRAIFGTDGPPDVVDRNDDARAAERVISRMAEQRLISPAEARRLVSKIEELDEVAWRVPATQAAAGAERASSSVSDQERHEHRTDRHPAPAAALNSAQDQVSDAAPEDLQHSGATERQQTLDEFLAPRPTVVAVTAGTSPSGMADQPAATGQVNTARVVASPRASLGQSLAEFLAAHNIRWGELIAGLLIVVCSIGLVMSLWTTITQMHRVIPSLIFLTGNTAIFGAGLYTLFRWRLQDTSRATLVIATLLVPLGILTGLSTGGIDNTSVLLNDPITIVSILGAGAIYITLIWQSSRALVGSSTALPMTIGVAGPAAVLPLVPAAVRTWEVSAGFIVYAGSLAVAAAVTMLIPRNPVEGSRKTLKGNASWRRALVIGVSAFSLAVLTGYVAFMLRAFDTGWLRIAVATLTGVVLLAAAAGSLADDRRRPKLALAGTVMASLGLLAGVSLLIPMMTSAGWIWTWALTFSVAAGLAALVLRDHRWTVLSTVPVSIAFLLASPSWASDLAWNQLPVWKRLIGGEPMLASLGIGLVLMGIAWVMRSADQRTAMRYTSGTWLAYATINAGILTVAPVSWMGAIPGGVLPVLLGSAVVAIIFSAGRMPEGTNADLVAGVGSAVSFAFWLSILKPLVIGQPFPGWLPAMWTLLATAGTGIAAAEFVLRRKATAKAFRMIASGFLLGAAATSIVLVIDATGVAAIDRSNTQKSIAVLFVSVLAWLWIGLSDRNPRHLMFARVFLVMTAVMVGHCYFHDSLMTVTAWRSGEALWAWSALGWSVVAAIACRDAGLGWIRKRSNAGPVPSLVDRLNWYDPGKESWDVLSAGLLIQTSTILPGLASAVGFGSLVVGFGSEPSANLYNLLSLPIAVLAAGGLVLQWRNHGEEAFFGQRWILPCLHLASVFVWVGWQAGIRMLVDPAEQLVLATSLAAAGCFAIDLIRRESKSVERVFSWGGSNGAGVLTATGLALIGISSVALLHSGWVPMVQQRLRPELFTTVSVAIWWSAGASMSAWLGHRYRSTVLAVVSAVLVPAVVILLMPLWLPTQWWVWIQSAAIASGVYAVTLRFVPVRRHQKSDHPILPSAIDVSLVGCLGVAVMTCLGLVAGIVLDEPSWMQLHHPAGLTLSTMAAILILFWHRLAGVGLRSGPAVSWPITLSLTSGHIALLLSQFVASSLSPQQWLPLVWTVVAAVSVVESCRVALEPTQAVRFCRWHAGTVIVAASLWCFLDGSGNSDYTIGLVASIVGGILVTTRAVLASWENHRGLPVTRRSTVITRALGWYAVAIGLVFVFQLVEANSRSEFLLWTMLMTWVGSWAIVWRMACPDKAVEASIGQRFRGMLGDSELSVLVLAALSLESFGVMSSPVDFAPLAVVDDPLLWLRLGIALAVALSVCFRYGRRSVCETAVATVLVSATLLGIRIAIGQSAQPQTLVTVICLVAPMSLAAIVFAAAGICRVMNLAAASWNGLVPADQTAVVLSVRRFADVLTRVTAAAVVLVIGLATWLLVDSNSDSIVPVAICGVALLSAALAELAERTGRGVIRHMAVWVGLGSVALFASVNVEQASYPMVSLSTRWFVGWVFIAAGLSFVVPKLLGATILERWRDAIRSGFVLAISLAIGSLIATLVQEGFVRVAGQTDLLVKPLYLGMAATLAMLSVMSTLAGIVSGPGYSYRDAWKLSDRHRAALVVAAQVFGGLTWFHLFLCKSPLANLGLRAYWPYVVMTLSFASVGVTEWARRRGDEVLEKTLKQTALFLPLVPVIGFWLSGAWMTSLFGESDASRWTYIQGRVSYQALLVAAALYYGVVSFLWKSGRARLVSIIIGNAALWVVLVQTPNWDFLSHPQAWLIPPAVCVLVATHFQRESLGAKTATAIRYAATLTIYVTSTADMLIQGVGSTIWGPIVLVTLAMIGAGAGVAFRVKPFLYLGTTFVLIGVTSMVWHAQQQIDAVWPWWVFGISTGVLLMIGLMAIEKNKPKLHRIATAMQQWDT